MATKTVASAQLRPVSGPVGLIVPTLEIAVCYLAIRLASALVLGSLSRWEITGPNALAWLCSGALVALALAPVVRNSRWGSRGTAFAVWAVLSLPGAIGLGIEGYLFRPVDPLSALASTATKLLTNVVLAIVAVRLLSSATEPGASEENDSVRRLGVFGWIWRLVVGSLSYFVFYFVFGLINALAYTKAFYETNPNLHLPPVEAVLLAQLIRAPLMVLGVLALVWALRGSRRRVALSLGALLYVVAGAAPYAETTLLLMPIGFSLATLTEVLFQNVLTGVVVAYLFRSASVRSSIRTSIRS